MAKIEMKASDLCELYILLEMYGQTYGTTEGIRDLTEAVKAKCREQGITDIRNPKNAGRKKVHGQETESEILELRRQGLTMRQIAQETNVSAGYVSKLIKKHMNR